MSERFKPVDPYAKLTSDKKLAKARPRLKLYRRPQLFTEILLASGAFGDKFGDKPEMKNSLDFLVGKWIAATNSEEEVAEKLVAPAKLVKAARNEEGAYITNRKVEEAAIRDGAEYLQEVFGFDKQRAKRLSRIFVRWHINNTKRIQRDMGVPEKPRYKKKLEIRRRHIIFAGYGPTLKIPQSQEQEKVAC